MRPLFCLLISSSTITAGITGLISETTMFLSSICSRVWTPSPSCRRWFRLLQCAHKSSVGKNPFGDFALGVCLSEFNPRICFLAGNFCYEFFLAPSIGVLRANFKFKHEFLSGAEAIIPI